MRSLLLILIGLFSLGSCAPQEVREVVVIGGGLMGSATSWHLANAGTPVLLLEQQDSVYTRGSSFGQTRITQKHSLQDDKWAYLHMRSLRETSNMIDYLNERYQTARPYIMEDIYTTAIVTNVHPKERLDELRTTFERQEVDYKVAATQEEAAAQFKMNIADDEVVIREYGLYTGTLNPQALINHLHLALNGLESEVRYKSRVTSLTRERGHYKIELESTDSGEKEVIYAERVVSAAGPYSGRLLAELNPGLDKIIEPQRVFQAFLRLKSDVFENLDIPNQVRYSMGFPVVSEHQDDPLRNFSTTIEAFDTKGNPTLKVGGYLPDSSVSNLDMVWDLNLSQEEQEFALQSTRQYLEKLGIGVSVDELEYLNGRSSVYSMTDTAVPYVTQIPDASGKQLENLVMLAGMSGMGAEGAMAYGRVAATLLMGEAPDEPALGDLIPWLGYERLQQDLANGASF